MTISERLAAEPAAQHGQRLRVAAASEYTGLSQSTLNKLRVFGGGPQYLKLGRSVIYDTRALDAWLASNGRRSTSEDRAS
jgi:predicted DNA-binding transcriptional regulator AlpA